MCHTKHDDDALPAAGARFFQHATWYVSNRPAFKVHFCQRDGTGNVFWADRMGNTKSAARVTKSLDTPVDSWPTDGIYTSFTRKPELLAVYEEESSVIIENKRSEAGIVTIKQRISMNAYIR